MATSLKRLDAALTRCPWDGSWGFSDDTCTTCGRELVGRLGRVHVDAARECCLTLPTEPHGTRGHDCALA